MRPGLWALLAASLAGSAWLAGQPDADSPVLPAAVSAGRVAAPRPLPAPAPAADPALAHAGLPARPADWPTVDRAALQAWQGSADRPGRAGNSQTGTLAEAKPAASAGAATPAPAAAFPYRWIGQLDDGGGAPQMLLSSAQRSVGVRLGQVLDGRWRIAHDAQGVLMATALPDGPAQPVPGAAAGPPP